MSYAVYGRNKVKNTPAFSFSNYFIFQNIPSFDFDVVSQEISKTLCCGNFAGEDSFLLRRISHTIPSIAS
jgi:hypothetical protein